MEKTKKSKIIIKAIVFLTIGVILFQMATTILLPEWIAAEDVTLIMRGLYGEPENSIDVLLVGDSNVYRGVSPMEIWNEKGYTCYNRSSPGQRIWYSYYLVKDALESQQPKVVILDVNEAFDDTKQSEESSRKMLNNMKMGPIKWEALQDPIMEFSNYDKLSYIFPMIRYHSRWSSLKPVDFRRFTFRYRMEYKGYLLIEEIGAYKGKIGYRDREKKHTEQIGEKSKQYIKKIKELCEANGAKLLLMEIPSPTVWTYGKSQAVKQFAQEQELEFMDMNESLDIVMNWEEDSFDEGYHLNLSGARKVSKLLGEYLGSHYNLTDHRNDEQYSSWHEDYKKYIQDIEKQRAEKIEKMKKDREL